MKLLEKAISGYESKVDVAKNDQDELSEAQAKVLLSLEPPSELNVADPVRALDSGLDGVIFLETPIEECIRRAANRKVDPTTGNI